MQNCIILIKFTSDCLDRQARASLRKKYNIQIPDLTTENFSLRLNNNLFIFHFALNHIFLIYLLIYYIDLLLGTRFLILDTSQIVDDSAPTSRLEGDIFYRGYWMLDTRCMV